MLAIESLCYSYGEREVFRGVDADLAPGRILCSCGPNGAGKTTLLKCIVGILTPSAGFVRIDGRETTSLSRRELARMVAYVPQDLPVRFPVSVFDTVLGGRRPHMSWRPAGTDIETTSAILVEMGLADLAMRDMDRLSGGQVQKVLLARALVQETPLIVLDEPTSNLDLRHQLEIMELIDSLVKTRELAVIMAVHDLNLAARFADTIMMLGGGGVYCTGSPLETLTPANIRAVYGIEAAVRKWNGHLTVQPLSCTDTCAGIGPLMGVS